MNAIRNPFTYRIPVIKLAVNELQSAKFYAILLVLVALPGIFILSPVISSSMNDVVIRNTGQISTGDVIATSGSARDIQVAVDQVVAAGGVGEVFIPEGTFNFVEVGAPWVTVGIPSGVNLFGAPTERNANGQVIEWKTVLVMPYDVPGDWSAYSAPWWFKIIGNGDPNKPSRFSDIKLVGYRSLDPTSTTIHQGIDIQDVVDFRIDHCYFEHIAGRGIGVSGISCCGVIDHCYLVNPVALCTPAYADGTVGYGVAVGRAYGDVWEDDITKVLGKYTDYSVYIEDCYFEKWRHCVAANNGAHYVFRNCTIKDDFGFGSLDAHGWGNWDGEKITMVGTRAVEIYNCVFSGRVEPPPQQDIVWIRGGALIAFNNTVTDQNLFVSLSREADPEVSKCYPHDCYIWNNELINTPTLINPHESEEDVDYFLHAPETFNYEPYPYPHPLTLETAP